MGFGDLDVTSIQKLSSLSGGSGVEYGCWSGTGASTTQAVPTTFQTLVGGIMIGNGTTHGRALSICEGPTIDFTIADATDGPLFYIAFGW